MPRASLEMRGSAVPVRAWQRIPSPCPPLSHGELPGHGAAPGLALIHLPSSAAGLRELAGSSHTDFCQESRAIMETTPRHVCKQTLPPFLFNTICHPTQFPCPHPFPKKMTARDNSKKQLLSQSVLFCLSFERCWQGGCGPTHSAHLAARSRLSSRLP